MGMAVLAAGTKGTCSEDARVSEESVEFWGGVRLLRSLNQFFDRTLYFVSRGIKKQARR